VPGLCRSEVAGLAGVSVEYRARLERGNLAGVSDGVLDLAADPGFDLVAFTAPPGTPDDALKLLAGWAATHTPADALSP
jgi:hypothetical protein